MPADAVAEVKARLDIVEVIGAYVRLQRAGREHTGLCPFHSEKTPSFTVSAERQVWYCFGCQEGGDMIAFVEKVERVDFRQALESLAERAGIELERGGGGERRGQAARRKRALDLHARAQAFYEHVLWATPTGAPGRELLGRRAVPEEAARRFGIGFAPAGGTGGNALLRYLTGRGVLAEEVADAGLSFPQGRGGARDRFRHRLVFPIRDPSGQTIAFGGRALGDDIPKYLNSSDTPIYSKKLALFGIDQARAAFDTAGAAVIVEGYFDVVAAHAAGVRNVVASSGTALTEEQVRALHRQVATLVLCFDSDPAGRRAADRAVDVAAGQGMAARICVLPAGYKDPDELVRADPEGFARCVAEAQPEWGVLLDWAVGQEEGSSIEARRAALGRALPVLLRIPEAATRELYTGQVARRFDLRPEAVAADLERARTRGPRRAPAVVSVPPAPTPPIAGEVHHAEEEGHELSAWEAYLGGAVVQRPELARRLVERHGLDPSALLSAPLRRLFAVAVALPDRTPLPTHALHGAERHLAARLLLQVIPELGADAPEPSLDRALAANVDRVRVAGHRRQLAELERDLMRARDRGDEPEVLSLVERIHALHRLTHGSVATPGPDPGV
ncbi:MAG: DNA primase [Candidatus Dormibacteria bacterium]